MDMEDKYQVTNIINVRVNFKMDINMDIRDNIKIQDKFLTMNFKMVIPLKIGMIDLK